MPLATPQEFRSGATLLKQVGPQQAGQPVRRPQNVGQLILTSQLIVTSELIVTSQLIVSSQLIVILSRQR